MPVDQTKRRYRLSGEYLDPADGPHFETQGWMDAEEALRMGQMLIRSGKYKVVNVSEWMRVAERWRFKCTVGFFTFHDHESSQRVS